MAKNLPFPIILLIVLMTWLMMNAEGNQPAPIMTNRQSRHIFLFPQLENYLPSFDLENSAYNLPMNIASEGSFTSHGSEARIPNKFNKPVVSSQSLYSDDSGNTGGRTFAGFSSFFGNRNGPICPQCPQCPAFPVFPPCPTLSCPSASCPSFPTQAETLISLTPQETECLASALTGTDSLSPCAKVSAALKGDIDVILTPPSNTQVISIGIAAVLPNTQVKLTCNSVPTGPGSLAKTQNSNVTLNSAVITTGFLQIVAAATSESTVKTLKCSWTSIP